MFTITQMRVPHIFKPMTPVPAVYNLNSIQFSYHVLFCKSFFYSFAFYVWILMMKCYARAMQGLSLLYELIVN